MAPRDPTIIDGFKSVQAMKRAASRAPQRPRVHDSSETVRAATAPSQSASEAPPVGGVAATNDVTTAAPPIHVGGHVVMPTKRLVICYACGYSHTIAGKLHHAYCPKCRTQLKTDDVLIAGEQQTDVLTIGNVTITPEAVLAPGIRITGQKILLDGDARGISMLFATDVLELGSHAQFDLSSLEPMTHLLRVLAGQDVSLVEPLSCTALEIAGTLRGNVTVYQRATIHAGGCFVGAFKGPRLEMEDGAGLIGDVDLSPLYEQTPTKRKTTGGVSGKVIATLAHAFVLGVSTVATWFICIWLRH